jgi:hypothetical protein
MGLVPTALCVRPASVPVAFQNEAETGDIDRHQDDGETGPGQHRNS